MFNEVHWFNFPELESKPYSKDNYLIRRVLYTINKTNPVIVYISNGSIKELHKLTHTDVDYLNNVGIDIYLYEPIVSYYKGKHKKTPQFYHEFIGNEDVNLNRSKELDSISLYATRNKLTNVTVHTCDYDIEKYYPHYSNLKLVCDDIFLQTTMFNPNPVPPKNKIERTFLSLNWRYATHRHIIASYLQNYNSYVSWQFKLDFETFSKNMWFDVEEYRTHIKQYRKLSLGTLLLEKRSPLNLDNHIKEPIHIKKFDNAYVIPEHTTTIVKFLRTYVGDVSALYNKSFMSIVNESRFAQPTGNYSEKVFQAILHQHPFILVAPPFTLKYMREMGFKTFSEFWDESYDIETVHSERMLKVLKLIDMIGSKSVDELEELRIKMTHVLRYNAAVLKSRVHNLSVSINPVK